MYTLLQTFQSTRVLSKHLPFLSGRDHSVDSKEWLDQSPIMPVPKAARKRKFALLPRRPPCIWGIFSGLKIVPSVLINSHWLCDGQSKAQLRKFCGNQDILPAISVGLQHSWLVGQSLNWQLLYRTKHRSYLGLLGTISRIQRRLPCSVCLRAWSLLIQNVLLIVRLAALSLGPSLSARLEKDDWFKKCSNVKHLND